MISWVNVKKGNKKFRVFNPLLISDYVSITKKSNGSIGKLFWIFLIAVMSLISFSLFRFGD